MKILVSGASGFIGGALTKRLLNEKNNDLVRVMSRRSNSDGLFLNNDRLACVLADVTDKESCRSAMEGVDTVFHCAGVLGGWGKPDSLFWDVNYAGTKNMLEAAKDAGVKKFIHVSSCGIFGPLKNGDVASEEHPYNPTNIYEKTKAEADKLALNFAKDGFQVTVVRPGFVYGPGDLHLLPFFRAVKSGRFFYINDGKAFLHPTYIDDLINGLLLAYRNSGIAGQGFNFAGPEPVSVKTLVSSMCKSMNIQEPTISIPKTFGLTLGIASEYLFGFFTNPPLTRAQVDFFSSNYTSNIEKSKLVLGYAPKVGIAEGIRKTINWYQQKNLL